MLVTQEQFDSVIDILRYEPTLAIDTETTGLGETDLPFGVSIATKDQAYYFDERVTPDMWIGLQLVRPSTFVLQNAKFDIRMLNSKRVDITKNSYCYDLTSLGRLVRNDHMKYGLDDQAKRMLGIAKDDRVKAYIKEHNLYRIRKDFFGEEIKEPQYDRVPIDLMAEYAAHDARITYDIYASYEKILAQSAAEVSAVFEQESDLIPVCYKMERHGLLLTKEYTLKAYYHEGQLLALSKASYQQMTGNEYTNSAKSIQKSLKWQLPLTDKGNPSLDDDVLEEIIVSGESRDKEIAETVRRIRLFDKRISTYYKSYLNLIDGQNIIHPAMWIAGTRTGRFSYSDPNLQNMPKEENSTDPYVIRGCFMPRPGRTYVSFDYSQMEYKMAVAYANQKDVIEQIQKGADFHKATADLVGIPRSQAKTLNFAVLYGAGIDKIATMLRCTKEEANRLKIKYYMALPKVEQLIDQVIATGRGRGYVKNWMGRRLYADKEFCYALPNHLIQSGGADVVKKAMVQIDREFPQLMMVLQVHDQLVFELTDEEMVHVPRIKEIMETAFPPMNGVSLTVDVSYSKVSLADRDMKKWGDNGI